ncbi:MAG: thiamine phosphate synthase, partial [Methylobacterium sp.]|nr:thiamine phosphate synthase [Methylobacterium sp.]
LMAAPKDPRLVARLGLDGVHAQASDDLGALVEALKPQRILGVGGLRSRHEAMEAGERHIDYVMFGEPRADGFVPPLAQTIERAEWWATIFNVPCVAYAPDLDSVAPLTATGTEFIAVGPWLFEAEDPAARLAEARRIAKSKVLEREERSSAPDLASRG